MQKKNFKKFAIIGAIVILLLMSTTSTAAAIIAIFEGKKLKAYQDQAGIWTIGFGSTFNIDENRKVKEGDTITEATALRWLKTITANLQADIKALVKVPVNQNQLDSLTSLAYNIGPAAFKSSTLLRTLNAGNPKIEVADQFLRWIFVKGVENKGLINRRTKERELFLK
jgi:lysozyme